MNYFDVIFRRKTLFLKKMMHNIINIKWNPLYSFQKQFTFTMSNNSFTVEDLDNILPTFYKINRRSGPGTCALFDVTGGDHDKSWCCENVYRTIPCGMPVPNGKGVIFACGMCLSNRYITRPDFDFRSSFSKGTYFMNYRDATTGTDPCCKVCKLYVKNGVCENACPIHCPQCEIDINGRLTMPCNDHMFSVYDVFVTSLNHGKLPVGELFVLKQTGKPFKNAAESERDFENACKRERLDLGY